MRNFWALPAVLRIALASSHSFSVFDDLLAYPQYEVIFPNTFITENDATSLLAHSASRSIEDTPHETSDLSKPSPSPKIEASADAPLEETYEAVVLDGRRYLCSIPVMPEEQPANSTASAEQAKAEEEKELMRATDRGWELLEGMTGNCIYYISGWWSYSFCYKDEVKQFHQLPPSRGVPLYPPVEDTSVKSFILGKYTGEKWDKDGKPKPSQKTLGKEQGSKEAMDEEGNVKPAQGRFDGMGLGVSRLETKGSSRYMVQRLSGGTECDLTGRERKIEVQFHCHPQAGDRISMIKETATCSYLMIIYTPRLCNDVAFQPPQENRANPISCQPVITDDEVDQYTLDSLVEKAEAERLMALENDNPLREMSEGLEGQTKRGPLIGGVEVGAQQLVGGEGREIEKSVVVGGGKETYLGTVATSAGHQMSKEEMRKHQINDPKDVEKLKKNLSKLAGPKSWKLDLVDTPRGKEFRGIIENDSEDEETKPEKGSGKAMKKDEDQDQVQDAGEAEQEEEPHEGSEEIYKDEL